MKGSWSPRWSLNNPSQLWGRRKHRQIFPRGHRQGRPCLQQCTRSFCRTLCAGDSTAYWRKISTLRILTPPMETSDPPNDTPGALNQVVLTPHDIPRIFREGSFVKGSLDHLSDETRSWQPCAQRMQNSEPGSLPQRSWGKRNGGKGYEILNFPTNPGDVWLGSSSYPIWGIKECKYMVIPQTVYCWGS